MQDWGLLVVRFSPMWKKGSVHGVSRECLEEEVFIVGAGVFLCGGNEDSERKKKEGFKECKE